MNIFIKSIAVALVAVSSFVAQSAYAACQSYGNYTRGSSAIIGGYRIAGGNHTAYYNVGLQSVIGGYGGVVSGNIYLNDTVINGPITAYIDSVPRAIPIIYNGNITLANANERGFLLTNTVGTTYLGQNHDAFFGNVCVDTQLPVRYFTLMCPIFGDCTLSAYMSNIPSSLANLVQYASDHSLMGYSSMGFSSMKTGSCPSGTKPIQATNYRTQDGVLRSGTYIFCVQC